MFSSTCPPSLQSWALFNIPNTPSIFPSESLWGNMDYLFLRIPNQTEFEDVPWIIWYLWKAKNDKVFNNLDRSPLEVIEIARKESKEWFLANSPVEENPINRGTLTPPPHPHSTFRNLHLFLRWFLKRRWTHKWDWLGAKITRWYYLLNRTKRNAEKYVPPAHRDAWPFVGYV